MRHCHRLAVISALLCCLAACGNKTAEQAHAPGPAAAGSSTSPVTTGGILSAPADYVKGTVDNIGKAKAAKALYEKTEKERMKTLDQLGSDAN